MIIKSKFILRMVQIAAMLIFAMSGSAVRAETNQSEPSFEIPVVSINNQETTLTELKEVDGLVVEETNNTYQAVDSNIQPAVNESVDSQIHRHELELSFQSFSFIYREPGFMRDKGWMYGVDGRYTFKLTENQPVHSLPDIWRNGNMINMYRLEGRFAGGDIDYSSNGTGTLNGIRDYIFETRGLIGYDFLLTHATTITPYLGFGYRYLLDLSGASLSSTNAVGYDRESNYFYLPMGLEAKTHINNDWQIGIRGEYDLFLYGIQKSHLENAAPYYNTLVNHQSNGGFGLRGSLRIIKENQKYYFLLEPFINYWKIKDSKDAMIKINGIDYSRAWEPKNSTTEIGLKLGLGF